MRGKKSRYILNKRLGGPQSWFGLFGKGKNLLSLPEIETHFAVFLAIT
jgi:hypothetical protein